MPGHSLPAGTPLYSRISFKITLMVLIFVIFALAAAGLFYFQAENNRIRKTFQNWCTTTAGRIVSETGNLKTRPAPEALIPLLQAEMLSSPGILAVDFTPANKASPAFRLAREGAGIGLTRQLTPPAAPGEAVSVVSPSLTPGYQTLSVWFSQAALRKDLNNTLINTVIFISILSLFLLFTVLFSLQRVIVNPILQLNQAVNRFAHKDFSIRTRLETQDEIGDLGRNFNRMADSIQQYHGELHRQLYTDQLTGLPNRRKILQDIEETHEPTLILMNIDFFKEINDFYGNRMGDLVLKEMTIRLQSFQYEYGYRLYRMSGDEYAMLFDSKLGRIAIADMITRISVEINEKPFVLKGNDIHVTSTFGVARAEDMENSGWQEGKWRNLATHADMALKEAKKKQRRFLVFDQSMDTPKMYENNIIWKEKLKEAIRVKNIVPYFQPIVNNRTGQVEKYECLVRLIDNEGRVVSPNSFLDIAKKTHLYGEITRNMMERSFDVFRGKNDLEFSINLTVKDIMEEETNEAIIQKLKANHGMANQVVFEILESEGIENYKDVMIFIEEVKDIGCKIAIDDFGSGYSNFEHILRLDVDYIKIDASLIKNIDIEPNAQIITRTIVNFSKELGLKTISEYVHSRNVFDKASLLGVDYSQGYFFGEPSAHLLGQTKFDMALLPH